VVTSCFASASVSATKLRIPSSSSITRMRAIRSSSVS
jgi:hypothetical protein